MQIKQALQKAFDLLDECSIQYIRTGVPPALDKKLIPLYEAIMQSRKIMEVMNTACSINRVSALHLCIVLGYLASKLEAVQEKESTHRIEANP